MDLPSYSAKFRTVARAHCGKMSPSRRRGSCFFFLSCECCGPGLGAGLFQNKRKGPSQSLSALCDAPFSPHVRDDATLARGGGGATVSTAVDPLIPRSSMNVFALGHGRLI